MIATIVASHARAARGARVHKRASWPLFAPALVAGAHAHRAWHGGGLHARGPPVRAALRRQRAAFRGKTQGCQGV
jgi:hypothetical protein